MKIGRKNNKNIRPYFPRDIISHSEEQKFKKKTHKKQ